MAGNHVQRVIEEINAAGLAVDRPLVVAGENIDSGSRIGGMARGLELKATDCIMNVGNCELTHCGIGFGMMLDGSHFSLFMKQLDFLFLGLDQLVNTFQFIRAHREPELLGGFTIYLVVCDQGHQGAQSSFNALGDVASLTRLPVFCLNAVADVEEVVQREFFGTGVRIVAISQRQFGMDPLEMGLVDRSENLANFQYRSGEDVTVVSCNFALRQATTVVDELAGAGVTADLFHRNFVPSADWNPIRRSAKQTGRLLVLDDSRSYLKTADALLSEIAQESVDVRSRIFSRRDLCSADFGVTADLFDVQDEAVAWVLGGLR